MININFRSSFNIFVMIMLALITLSVNAQDEEVVNIDATITGNQEQPKVLYIVPWKQTKDTSILSRGLESRLSDVFDHVDRSEHMREVEFFETMAEQKSDQAKPE